MGNSFSLSEVIQMAEEIERNGVKFYTQGAKAVKDPTASKVMLDLAEMEKTHEQTFRDMRSKFCGKEDEATHDPNGDVDMYIRLMADTHVFNLTKDVTELVTSIQTARAMLQLAISFEKDTIVFFNALKEMVVDENRTKVDLLIKEEAEHIRLLNNTMKQLND